jgi:hypothetical protein
MYVAGDTNYQGEGERRVPFPNWGNLKHSLFRTEPYWKQKKFWKRKNPFPNRTVLETRRRVQFQTFQYN